MKAYLVVSIQIGNTSCPGLAKIYTDNMEMYLKKVSAAASATPVSNEEEKLILYGFDSVEEAQSFLDSELFQNDVYRVLKNHREVNFNVSIFTPVQ